jgi:heptaprenylglyceryl phosphate synthase
MSVLSKLRVISQVDPDKARDKEERKKIHDGIGRSPTDAINITGTTGVDKKLLSDIGVEISDPSASISKNKLRIVTPTSPEQAPPELIYQWLEQNLYNIAGVPAPLNTIDRSATYEVRKMWMDAFYERGIPFPSPKIFFVGYVFLNPDATSTRLVNADVQDGEKKIEDYIKESIRWAGACYLENSGAYADPNLVRRAKKYAALDLGYPDFPIIYGGGIATEEQGRDMSEAGRVYMDKEKKIPSYTTLVLGDIIHKDLEMHSKIVEEIKKV